MMNNAGFVGYDKDGLFVHYCHCSKWGDFGFNVSLRQDKLGVWFCREHKPEPTDEPKPFDQPIPAQGEMF
jgi:hypothetical protein